MTSELPAAAGADEDAAAAVRASSVALASGHSQPTRRRRFREAKFLKLSSEQFLLTCVLLVALEAVAGLQVRKFYVFTTIDQQSLVYGLLSGMMLACVCLATLWALGQRQINRAARFFASLILAVAGLGALMHASIGLGIVAGATNFLVTAYMVERFQRQGLRLLRAPRASHQRKMQFQLSLRTLLEVTIVISIFFALRLAFRSDWRAPYSPLRHAVGIAISQGVAPAATAFVFVVGWFAVDRLVVRTLLMASAVLVDVGITWSGLGNMPQEYVTLLLLRISLPTYGGLAIAMAIALMFVRRIYGLRLVRVPRRVARSSESQMCRSDAIL